MIDLCEIWFWSYNSRLIWFHIVNRSLRLVSHGLVPIGAPKMEIIAIIILALIVAAFAVYALRNGTKSSVPPVSVEVEAEKMRLASEVERLQAAEGRANDLQVHTVALERDLENERALLKKLEEEHGVLKSQVEEARLDVQELMAVKSEHQTTIQNLNERVADRDDLIKRVSEYEQQIQEHIANNSTLDTDAKNLRERLRNEETAHSATDRTLQGLRQRVEDMQSNIQDLVALRREHETTIENLNERVADRDDLAKQLHEYEQQMQKRAAEVSNLETTNKNLNERLDERGELEKLFGDQFKALSSATLDQQRKSFLATADQTLKEREKAVRELVKPLSDKIETLDKARIEGQSAVSEQIKMLAQQTQNLSTAMTRPEARGRWGEIQVERVLELSGLRKGIDYQTQVVDTQGTRPDFVVHMPHGRDIILDAKVSLPALIDAAEAKTENDKESALKRHSQQIRNHATQLADKAYWNNLSTTPEFVVMVIPEFAFLPAVERDTNLIERALSNKVVIVTPSTLLALLKVVERGWQQIRVAKTAQEISDLGKDLHDSLANFADHIDKLGRSLKSAVGHYNKGIGSFERRIVPRARRFHELGVPTGKEIQDIPEITVSTRELRTLPQSESSEVKQSSDLSDDGRELDSRLAQAFSSDNASS